MNERSDVYERIASPCALSWSYSTSGKECFLINEGYVRDWRTGLWHHFDEPHTWFTMEAILAMNPMPSPKRCGLCGYTPVFYGAACGCE